jgi:hypothetical protein
VRLDPERFSIVLVGAWNVSILNPEWVATVLFDGEPIGIELLLGDLTWRFRSAAAVLEVGEQRVQIRSAIAADAELTDGKLEPVERLALQLLEALPETPVRAVGINFSFRIESAVPELDRAESTSPRDGSLRSLRIQQTLDLSGRQVNVHLLREGLGTGEVVTRVEVNHHDEVAAGTVRHRGRVASELLRDRTIAARALSVKLAEQRLAEMPSADKGG